MSAFWIIALNSWMQTPAGVEMIDGVFHVTDWAATAFTALIAAALPAAYLLLGATWLVMKTEGDLQQRAIDWARRTWLPVVTGIVAISLATPLTSPTVRGKWFALAVGVFVIAAAGMACSLFPYVIVDRIEAWQAASSSAALRVILAGVAVSVPAILAYTVMAYRTFGGKARPLDCA